MMEVFKEVREALKTEWKEEREQFNDLLLNRSISYRVKNGFTWYPVSLRDSSYGFGDYITVQLERTKDKDIDHLFSSGKNVTVFHQDAEQKTTVKGVVKSVDRNIMRITLLTDDLPEWIEKSGVGIDLQFDESGYHEMMNTLDEVENAKNCRLADFRDIIYSHKIPGKLNIEFIDNATLNESQNHAIKNILDSQDIALVHGPPGTGKTTTVVNAIVETLNHEDQVLVCAPSNTAVDVLVEKLHAKGIDVLRLGNPARMQEEIIMHTLDHKIGAHNLYKDVKDFRKRADQFRHMAGKYKRNFGKAERDQRQLLYNESRGLAKEANKIEDHIVEEIINKSPVIACTLVNSVSRFLKKKRFTTVFIDEAGQALEPMSWIPITVAEKIVLAGDHLQLPPTVKSIKAFEQGLAVSLFEKAITNVKDSSVMLETQYRMNKEIMEFPGETFYNSKLKADSSVAGRYLAGNKELFNPMLFVDTSGASFDESFDDDSYGFYNEQEANFIYNHVVWLDANYDSQEPLHIGIISPYKKQVELLKKLFSEFTSRKIKISTVDGFQGQERDVIYISLVRSNAKGEIGFLKDERRMNVAITRAKKMVLVIGDSSTLCSNGFFKGFVEYTEKSQAYKSVYEYEAGVFW